MKPENSKTVRQWGLLGRIPVEGANPSYIWDDYYGRPCTYYYLEQDTREMTEAEKSVFDEAEEKKKERRRTTAVAAVREWRENHPDGTKAACNRDTGLNPKTIRKWWEVPHNHREEL